MLCSNFSDAHIWSLECMWSLLHTRVFSSISSVYQFPFQFPKWFPRRRLHSLKGGNFISSMRLGGKRKGIWELVVRKCTNRHWVEGPQTELWLFSVLIILRWFAWICPSPSTTHGWSYHTTILVGQTQMMGFPILFPFVGGSSIYDTSHFFPGIFPIMVDSKTSNPSIHQGGLRLQERGMRSAWMKSASTKRWRRSCLRLQFVSFAWCNAG